MATLRYRQGKYFVDYYLDNRRIRKDVGSSRKIAELCLKRIESKIARGKSGAGKKDKEFNALFDGFLAYSKTHHSPNTHKRYRAALGNFKRYIEGRSSVTKISHLTPEVFDDYKQFRMGEEAQSKAIDTELRTLRIMLDLAGTRGYIKR